MYELSMRWDMEFCVERQQREVSVLAFSFVYSMYFSDNVNLCE